MQMRQLTTVLVLHSIVSSFAEAQLLRTNADFVEVPVRSTTADVLTSQKAIATANVDPCVGELDACGLCNGPGAIYDCGCSDIPEGDCDCDGNQLDALGECGGPCEADANGNGICDDAEIAGCTDEAACNYDGAQRLRMTAHVTTAHAVVAEALGWPTHLLWRLHPPLEQEGRCTVSTFRCKTPLTA